MNILSFDVANKSLAVSLINYDVKYDLNILNCINKFKEKRIEISRNLTMDNIIILLTKFVEMLDKIKYIYTNKVTIKFAKVNNFFPYRKIDAVSIIERTEKIYSFLIELDKILLDFLNDEKFTVLIEYQMGPNVKTRTVSDQIVFHFMKYKFIRESFNEYIYIVGASLKNLVYIGDEKADYSNFVSKYTKLYTANKEHAKFNMFRLLKYLNQEIHIKNIEKKNYDDIADSIMMSFVWVYNNIININT